MGLNIGVDIDDTLVDVIVHFLEKFNQENSTSYEFNKLTNYFICDDIEELSQEEMFFQVRKFIKEQQFNLNLNVPAFEKLQEFKSKGHNLHIITARNEELVEITTSWLESLFGKEFFSSINFTYTCPKLAKSSFVEQLEINVMIDDAPHHATQIVEQTPAKVILYHKPWNKTISHEKISRVYSWEEIEL